MLSYLADYENFFGPLRVFRSQTFRTVGAAVTAALIGFLIGPWLIAKLRKLKFGQHYDDDRTGDLAARFDKKNTPTMGGLLIFAAVFFSSFLWAAPNIWVVIALFVYTALTAVGFRDDWLKVVRKNRHGISSREKIFWQTLVTVLALPINLVAGLLGMNVGGIPFAESASGFAIIVTLLILLTAVLGYQVVTRLRD